MFDNMKTPTLALMAVLVAATGAAGASPALSQEDDHIALQNDRVVVRILDNTTSFEALRAGDADAAPLAFDVLRLVEYRDLDGNDEPDENEILATLDMRGAQWNVTANESADAVSATLAHAGPVAPATGGAPSQLLANLSLPTEDANVTLTLTLADDADAVALALTIASWPFVDPAGGSRLALVTDVAGRVERAVGAEDEANVTVDGARVGELAWSAKAKGKTASGADVDVPVVAAVSNASENATRIVLTYDADGLSSLSHDATAGPALDDAPVTPGEGGLSETIRDAPGPAAWLALAGVAVAALALRRR